LKNRDGSAIGIASDRKFADFREPAFRHWALFKFFLYLINTRFTSFLSSSAMLAGARIRSIERSEAMSLLFRLLAQLLLHFGT
jgi:hypothetical protein